MHTHVHRRHPTHAHMLHVRNHTTHTPAYDMQPTHTTNTHTHTPNTNTHTGGHHRRPDFQVPGRQRRNGRSGSLLWQTNFQELCRAERGHSVHRAPEQPHACVDQAGAGGDEARRVLRSRADGWRGQRTTGAGGRAREHHHDLEEGGHGTDRAAAGHAACGSDLLAHPRIGQE